jgi:hypothetical protein
MFSNILQLVFGVVGQVLSLLGGLGLPLGN